MEKEVGVISEDDDFFNLIIMLVDINNELEEYEITIQYLKSMNFSNCATKQIRTRIVHKSWSYTLICNFFNFWRTYGILCRAVGKMVVPKLLRVFHEEFCRGYFGRQIIVEKILTTKYYWPPIFKDTFYYCKWYKVRQTFANKFIVSGNLYLIPPIGPFKK